MAHSVIAAGHICVDMSSGFATIGTYETPGELLLPGTLVQMKPLDMRVGGSVTNTGLTFRLLGNEVTLIGRIGDDVLGKVLREKIAQYQVTDALHVDKSSSTSYSMLLQVPGTDAFVLHCPGANNTFSSTDVSDEALAGTELFHFGYPPMMQRMYENDGVELVSLLRRAKARGCITSLDFSSLDIDSDGALQDWPMLLTQLLPYVDVFSARFCDLCWILNRARHDALTSSTNHREPPADLDMKQDAEPLADWAIAHGCGMALVKCGAAGLCLRTAGAERLADFGRSSPLALPRWANRSILQKAYPPDHVRQSSGAGDVCIAAFLTALLDGEPPESCTLLGACEGSCCISTDDVFSGLMTLPQLKWRIAAELGL